MPKPSRLLIVLCTAFTLAGLACDDEHDHSSHEHADIGDDMSMGDMDHEMSMGDMGMGDMTVHTGTEALSDAGHFYVSYEYVDGDPDVAEDFSLLVSVYDAGQTALVSDAVVAFTPSMPSMGHGMDEDPTVTANGDGTFTVSNLAFSMGGTWLFEIEITSGETTDTVAFEVSCCG